MSAAGGSSTRIYPSSILTLPYDSSGSGDKLVSIDGDDLQEESKSKWKSAYQRAAAEVQSLREENARLFAINQTLLASPTVDAQAKNIFADEEEALPLDHPPPQPISDRPTGHSIADQPTGQIADSAEEDDAYQSLLEEHKTALHTLSLLQQHAAQLESIIEQWRSKCNDMQTDAGHLQQENAQLRDELSRTVHTHFEDQMKLSVLQQQASRDVSPQRQQSDELQRLKVVEMQYIAQKQQLEEMKATQKEDGLRQELQTLFKEEREQLQRHIEKLEHQLHIFRSSSPTRESEWDAASIAHHLYTHMEPSSLPAGLQPLASHIHMLDAYADEYQHASLLLRDVFALKPEQDIPRHQTHDKAHRPFLALIQELHRHYLAQCHITQQLQVSNKKATQWEQTLQKLKRAGSAEQRRRREAESQVKALTDLMGDYFAIASTS